MQAPVCVVLVFGKVVHVVGKDGETVRCDHAAHAAGGIDGRFVADNEPGRVELGDTRIEVDVSHIGGESGQHIVQRALELFDADAERSPGLFV